MGKISPKFGSAQKRNQEVVFDCADCDMVGAVFGGKKDRAVKGDMLKAIEKGWHIFLKNLDKAPPETLEVLYPILSMVNDKEQNTTGFKITATATNLEELFWLLHTYIGPSFSVQKEESPPPAVVIDCRKIDVRGLLFKKDFVTTSRNEREEKTVRGPLLQALGAGQPVVLKGLDQTPAETTDILIPLFRLLNGKTEQGLQSDPFDGPILRFQKEHLKSRAVTVPVSDPERLSQELRAEIGANLVVEVSSKNPPRMKSTF